MGNINFDKKYALLGVLLIITLGVFHPVLRAKLINLDDTQTIHDLNDPSYHLYLKNLFFRKSVGRYYRPIVTLSFLLDSKIWHFEPSGYHLTNYFFHVINVILVFLIACKIFERTKTLGLLSFVSALLFGIHPLVTESVAWVSGRSDVIATTFSLLAFHLYLNEKKMFSALCFFLALLTKESAVVLITIIPIFDFIHTFQSTNDLKKSAISASSWFTTFLLPMVIYMYLRTGGFKSIDRGVQMALSNGNGVSHPDKLLFFLSIVATIGFYLKKLFFPFPLNFAIHRINTIFYALVFLGICGVSLFFLLKKRFFIPLWICLLVITFAPAIPVAIHKIAWVPYAERYLYLTTIIWSLGLSTLVYMLCNKWPQYKKVILILLLVVAGVWVETTSQRLIVWQKGLSLWSDTVEKNPNFGKVLYKYGIALLDNGQPNRGIAFLKKAVTLKQDNEWKDLSLCALAKLAITRKDYSKAQKYMEKAIRIKPCADYYVVIADIYKHNAMGDSNAIDAKLKIEKAIQFLYKAYNIKNNPFYLYHAASLARRWVGIPQAVTIYQEIIKNHPHSKHAVLARKCLTTLNVKRMTKADANL